MAWEEAGRGLDLGFHRFIGGGVLFGPWQWPRCESYETYDGVGWHQNLAALVCQSKRLLCGTATRDAPSDGCWSVAASQGVSRWLNPPAARPVGGHGVQSAPSFQLNAGGSGVWMMVFECRRLPSRFQVQP
jgi:hypothetical protein